MKISLRSNLPAPIPIGMIGIPVTSWWWLGFLRRAVSARQCGQWMIAAMIAASIIFADTGCDSDVDKFEKKVKANINPVELQAWATNLIVRERTNGADYIYIPQVDVPKYIGLVYKEDGDPGYVTIERNRTNDPDAFVQILYGGGFGHWGLAIGFPTLILSNDTSCYNDLWKPGIYFWECQ